jgi:GNAT superfamily N-acetyltransferase
MRWRYFAMRREGETELRLARAIDALFFVTCYNELRQRSRESFQSCRPPGCRLDFAIDAPVTSLVRWLCRLVAGHILARMEVRDAVAGDAMDACAVLRRSITELCAADHGNDAAILARWLENKTPENVAVWIARPDASMLVAAESGAIVAVGMVTDAGEIILNYVSPDARFRGVSRALLAAPEASAAERGAGRCRLESTETAHRFYRANGYIEDGPPTGKFGMALGYRMAKVTPKVGAVSPFTSS